MSAFTGLHDRHFLKARALVTCGRGKRSDDKAVNVATNGRANCPADGSGSERGTKDRDTPANCPANCSADKSKGKSSLV